MTRPSPGSTTTAPGVRRRCTSPSQSLHREARRRQAAGRSRWLVGCGGVERWAASGRLGGGDGGGWPSERLGGGGGWPSERGAPRGRRGRRRRRALGLASRVAVGGSPAGGRRGLAWRAAGSRKRTIRPLSQPGSERGHGRIGPDRQPGALGRREPTRDAVGGGATGDRVTAHGRPGRRPQGRTERYALLPRREGRHVWSAAAPAAHHV
jgi:hypothetical protein